MNDSIQHMIYPPIPKNQEFYKRYQKPRLLRIKKLRKPI